MIFAGLAALALGLTPAELETRVARQLVQEFERVGRSAPTLDPALTQAARALATQALQTSAAEAAELISLTEAISNAGGFDPSPRALVVRGSPPQEPLQALLARTDLPSEPCTHAGIGAALHKDLAALVVLLPERKASLAPFPRTFSKAGARANLCAELPERFSSADLYVTRPSGSVEKRPAQAHDGSHCGALTFPSPGRHTVEVIAQGERGPEVAALFFVQVGTQAGKKEKEAVSEPATVEAARRAIGERINSLRQSNGLKAVSADEALTQVAQAYAERMANDNFFAHVSPEGLDLRGRLSRAGYPYLNAGENLGLAGGPLAAHFGIEHSPGHRKNLLEPAFSRLGVGVAFRQQEGRTVVRVVEVLVTPEETASDGGSLSPSQQAYRAIAQQRAALGLAPLRPSLPMERVAQAHLDLAIELDQPSTRLPGMQTAQRVFAAADVTSASVDLFIAESPALVTDSKSLADPRNDRVGVAVRRADSPRYGKDRFWVVVIYASSR